MSRSPEPKTSIHAELSDLQSEVDTVRPLLEKVEHSEPDPIELRAIATTLHAFYGGVERVFLVIAKFVDLKVPSSPQWHRELLDQMHTTTEVRSRILDDHLYHRLSDYLGFRHFFRHSYPMQLKWSRLKPLTHDLRASLNDFVDQIEEFIGK